MKGNPFVKITPITKYYMIVEQQKHLIEMRLWSQFKGIPYADSFNPEEQITVISLPKIPIVAGLGSATDVPSNKVALRIALTVIFRKSVSIFKSKI